MITQTKIWLSSPHMGDRELQYVLQAFESNWIAPLGPNVTAFENSIEDYLETGYHVACLSSGTAAIHLGLKLLGVGVGDDVICQSMTFSASANPIVYLGANPVFVDSEAESWNISPDLLDQAISERIRAGKRPKAIVAVHLYGMPYDADAVNGVAQKYGIPVLEDSAEALGSRYKGRKCGGLGDIGIFSFNGNKIITTSGGGALVTRNEEIKKQAIHWATQARDQAPHYQHSQLGFNYRMSNVLAGIGRGQMEVLSARVSARRRNFEFYKNALGTFEQIVFPEEPDYAFSNRWLTTILTSGYAERERIRLALEAENIESRPLWKPMHLQPFYQNCDSYANGISENLFQRGLCLPSGSNLESDDLEKTTEIIYNSLK